MSQKPVDGGLGLGKLKISIVFLLTITVLIGYLTRTRADVTEGLHDGELEALLDSSSVSDNNPDPVH